MVAANTNNIPLTSANWTLLADGDAGAVNVLIQLRKMNSALINLASALPSPSVVNGVVVSLDDPDFSAVLAAGQKLYGKAEGPDTTVAVMVGG